MWAGIRNRNLLRGPPHSARISGYIAAMKIYKNWFRDFMSVNVQNRAISGDHVPRNEDQSGEPIAT